MDIARNPFAPGAGAPPPEPAGRQAAVDAATASFARAAAGRPAQSLILCGLHGVGKTVLLDRFAEIAAGAGCRPLSLEAREGKGLAEALAPGLRSLLFAFSQIDAAAMAARRGARVLKGFQEALGVELRGADLGLGVAPERGHADSGSLEADLPDLLECVGEAAQAAGRPLVLLIDEMQALTATEFAALTLAVQRSTRKNLPLVLLGAGLPQMRRAAMETGAGAERLFSFHDIGALTEQEAIDALQRPAEAAGAMFTDKALDHILGVTERWPYFLQQWAYAAWTLAPTPKINGDCARRADTEAIAELDRSFFRAPLDRCAPSEKAYLHALAQLGAGPRRSADIAARLGVKIQSAAPTRNALMKKGLVHAPAHGETAFTIPLFDRYLQRIAAK